MRNSKTLWSGLIAGLAIFTVTFLNGCAEEKVNVTATGDLEGTVQDFTSEEFLNGVILTTNPPTISVASDSAGYFKFTEIDVGDYTLIARKNGYISESVAVAVEQTKTASVTLLLDRSSEYNRPPVFGTEFTPSNGDQIASTSITLGWTATDPNPQDTIMYNVKVYESNQSDFTSYTQLSTNSLELDLLRFSTVYYWQVTAYDSYDSAQSSLLSFRTPDLPDNDFMFAQEQDDGSYEIFSTDSLGTTEYQLTRNSRDDWQPRLSPRNDKIAYISHDQFEAHIFTMDRDGTNSRKVTRQAVAGYHNSGRGYSWSSSGSEVVYAHYNQMYFSNVTNNIHGVYATAPPDRHFRDMDYSPNSSQVVAQTIGLIADSSEIYIINLNGTPPTLLVPNLSGIIESPSYSVDGTKVMFTRDASVGVLPGNRQLDARIFIIDLDSKEITDLSVNKPTGTNDLNPRFSPNGAHIIFENSSNEPGSTKSIWIMDANGDNRRKLFDNAIMPDWG